MVNQYVLKVYPLGLGNEVYRTLEICGDSTLDQLCDAIMEDERLFAFACLRVPWNALFYWISNECGCSHFP